MYKYLRTKADAEAFLSHTRTVEAWLMRRFYCQINEAEAEAELCKNYLRREAEAEAELCNNYLRSEAEA